MKLKNLDLLQSYTCKSSWTIFLLSECNTCHFCLTLVSPSPTPPNLHQPSMSIGMGFPTWVDSLMGHQITSTMAEDVGHLSHADSVHLYSIWNNVCLPVSHFEQYRTTSYVCVVQALCQHNMWFILVIMYIFGKSLNIPLSWKNLITLRTYQNTKEKIF